MDKVGAYGQLSPRWLGFYAGSIKRLVVVGERQDKSSLRKAVLDRRDAMDANRRSTLSRVIGQKTVGLDAYRQSGTIMAYASFGSELQTDEFLRHVLAGSKTLILPRVNRAEKRLDLYTVKDLELGTWGIREPKPHRCAPVGSDVIDFVLVPGVAFDVRGGRLGYGGGFYDKLLAGTWSTRPWLVAGAFEAQIVEEIPLDTHDVVMDVLITESIDYFREAR